MERVAALKVGIVVVIGLGVFFYAWYLFAHMDFDHFILYATFDDTVGLQKQTPVRMNGVTVGEVKSIKLNSQTLKPVVELSIDDKYLNKIPNDSTIQISSGLLIANPLLEITPGVASQYLTPGEMWPQRYVQAQPLSALAQLSPTADQALKQLNDTVKNLTPKLAETLDQVHSIMQKTNGMMSNFEDASKSAKDLLADPKIRTTMDKTLDDLQAVSHQARVTATVISAELRATASRNSTKVDQIANSAIDILQNMADTVDAARTAVTRLSEQVSDPRIQQSLVETLELAKTTIARFNQIASDIHQFSGDPNVQSDLKESVASMKTTTQESQKLVANVNKLVEQIKLPNMKGGLGIGKPQFSVDFLERGQSPHFRSDLNLRIPFGNKNALDLGFYDFANNNRLNAQYETDLDDFGALRYGLYASKLGIGLDTPLNSDDQLSLDLFDPNHLVFNARARFQINNDFGLWLGADQLFRNTTPIIGVRLQR
jgi:phospholipid/cholesterol/gamma-HCH transport system substrate-binding protein